MGRAPLESTIDTMYGTGISLFPSMGPAPSLTRSYKVQIDVEGARPIDSNTISGGDEPAAMSQ
jgi:hypothetical protein